MSVLLKITASNRLSTRLSVTKVDDSEFCISEKFSHQNGMRYF